MRRKALPLLLAATLALGGYAAFQRVAPMESGARKRKRMKGAIGLFKAIKPAAQVALVAAGVAMVCLGAMRGEADTVLAKAIRLCLECIGIG